MRCGQWRLCEEYLDEELSDYHRNWRTRLNSSLMYLPYKTKTVMPEFITYLLKCQNMLDWTGTGFRAGTKDSIFISMSKMALDSTQLLIQRIKRRFLWGVTQLDSPLPSRIKKFGKRGYLHPFHQTPGRHQFRQTKKLTGISSQNTIYL
jgi:hypothetical protein